MSNKSLAIIGGGAAGIFSAIQASQNKNLKNITVFEASSNLLGKVKISGGGRCNVTHNCFEPQLLIKNYPRGKQFLKKAFYTFQPQDTVKWFLDRNVKLKAEPDGRMFPVTDSSQTIIDCFLHEIKNNNIMIKYNSRIKEIKKQQTCFELFDSNQSYKFDSLLLATGSSKNGYTLAESLGHTIVETVPSLFTFKIQDERLKDIAGVSCQNIVAAISFGKKKFQHSGPIVVTHWGISGPAILKLSAFAARELCENNYKANININFTPELHQEDITKLLNLFKVEHRNKNIYNLHPYEFPKSIWSKVILSPLDISPVSTWGDLSKKEMNQITEQIRNCTFSIDGKGIFKEEFVTCGGVSLKEVDSKTLQSKKCENLFFAGEVLDIDGITGGFNFQSAWTTGFIAGKSIE